MIITLGNWELGIGNWELSNVAYTIPLKPKT